MDTPAQHICQRLQKYLLLHLNLCQEYGYSSSAYLSKVTEILVTTFKFMSGIWIPKLSLSVKGYS